MWLYTFDIYLHTRMNILHKCAMENGNISN